MMPVAFAVLVATVPIFFAVAYPLAVFMRRRRVFATVDHTPLPRVSILVPARNEAGVLPAKLANFAALQYPRARVELLIGSDVSDDGTDEIVARASRLDPRVRLIRMQERRGKAGVLNRLLAEASGDVVVLTDASALLSPNAVGALVTALADPSVGAATIAYRPKSEGFATRLYWRLERRLRLAESERDVLVGVHGACAALRRSEIAALPEGMINDDYVLGLGVRAKGQRVRYVVDANATESLRPAGSAVLSRRRRIQRGNVQMLLGARRLLGANRHLLPWIFLHKLPRTLAPAFLLAALVAGVVGAASAVLGAQIPSAIVLGAGVFAAMGLARLGAPLFALTAGLWEGAQAAWRGETSPAVWETSVAADAVEPPPTVRGAKRLLDVAGAGVGLLLLSPVLAACAFMVRLGSRGPVLFEQERVGIGAGGRAAIFTMLKFRTMRVDAETASGPVWAAAEDPRITRVGRLLRRTRLDELPQLWNVLKGEMSLVGPRPERPFFCDTLRREIPLYDDRLLCLKPGITGLAQIHSGYDVDLSSVRRKILWDLSYAARLTSLPNYLRAEAAIFVETIVVMLTGRGAH